MDKFFDCDICPVCNQPPGVNPIHHLASAHSYVERFLPLEHHVEKIKKGRKNDKNTVKPKGKVVKNQPKYSMGNDYLCPEKTENLSNSKKSHNCCICNFSTKRRKDVYEHYAIVHFKRNILAELDGRKSCFYCDKQFLEEMSDHNIVRHLGVTHSMVEKFIDPKNHIKKYSMVKNVINPEKHDLLTTSNTLDVSNTKKPKEYSCFKCNYSASARKRMYGHFATVHFKNEILAQLDGSESCLYCDKLFHKELRVDNIVIHLGVSHSMVEDFISPQYYIKKSKRTKYFQPKKSAVDTSKIPSNEQEYQITPDKIVSVNIDDEKGSNEDDQKPVCCFCDYRTAKRRDLYAHYAWRHFQKQIEENYVEGTKCSICGLHLSGDKWKVLRHIGVTHNVVEEFLDAQYHLKKSSSGEKEKQTFSETSKDKVEAPGDQSFDDYSTVEINVDDLLEDDFSNDSTSRSLLDKLDNIKTEGSSADIPIGDIEVVDNLALVLNTKQERQMEHETSNAIVLSQPLVQALIKEENISVGSEYKHGDIVLEKI